MSNYIERLFSRLTRKPLPPEVKMVTHSDIAAGIRELELIRAFWLDPAAKVDDLITFVSGSPAYRKSLLTNWSGRTLVSCSGLISVCDDIFGYEVKIHPSDLMLDCNPNAYGLEREVAMRLYEAILTRVPGTSTFKFTPVKL